MALNDNEWHGQPELANRDKLAESVWIIAFDSKVTFPIIEEGFGLCKNAIYEAPPKNLKKLKNWAWLLPHPLIDQQERAHVEHFKGIIKAPRGDKNFLDFMVTDNEAWFLQYEPFTKCQSSEWKSNDSPRPKKLRFRKWWIKTMLVYLWFLRHCLSGICSRRWNCYWWIECFSAYLKKNCVDEDWIQRTWQAASLK